MLRRIAFAAANGVVGAVGLRPFTRAFYHIFIDGWGASYLDLDRTLRQIRRLGDEPWGQAWEQTAEQYLTLAADLEAQGRRGSAAELYRRAALYFRIGDYVISADTPLKRTLYGKCAAAYTRFAELAEPPIERIALDGDWRGIAGYLHRPPCAGPVPCVLIVPGLASSKEQPDFNPALLTARGIAAFAMDVPGHGEAFANSRLHFASYRAVNDALALLVRHPAIDPDRIAILGTSLGGTIALKAASEEQRLCAVVNVSGFYEPRHWFESSARFVETALKLVTGISGTPEVRDMVQQFTLRGSVARITCPLLTVHGDADSIVPVQEARQINAEATTDKVLRIYPGGDHGLLNTPAARFEILDWLSRRLLYDDVARPAALAG